MSAEKQQSIGSPSKKSDQKSNVTASPDKNKQNYRFVEQVDHVYSWQNTNRLLGLPGFCGLKTGITEAAGPCLAATYLKDGHSYTVVLLQSKSMEDRWTEA